MNKKVLAVAVSSALATPMAAHAVKYKLFGQVNRAMVYQNDGTNADIQFTDNISSGTRWRLTGSEDIGNGMKVGFNWEWQNSQNAQGAAIGSGDFGEAETMRKASCGARALAARLVASPTVRPSATSTPSAVMTASVTIRRPSVP